MVLFCDSVIRKKEQTEASPTMKRGEFTFFFIRQGALHILTATKANANAVLVFEYLKQVQPNQISKWASGLHYVSDKCMA